MSRKQQKDYKRLKASNTSPVILRQLPEIRLLSQEDSIANSARLEALLSLINKEAGLDLQTATDLRDCYNQSRELRENEEAKKVFQDFIKALQAQNTSWTHQEKRKLLQDLGVLMKPYTAKDLLETPQDEHPFQIKMVERSPSQPLLKRHTFFTDSVDPDAPDDHYVGVETGYYVVGPSESVIFYTRSPDTDEIIIELVAIRGVAYSCPLHEEFYAWLTKVVHTACDFRRNVRPTHPEKMTQVGLNLAARHVRILGWAKSFTARLSDDEIINHDEAAIGAASIAWGLLQAAVPHEIIGSVNSKLTSAGLPRLATQNIDPGSGFSFWLGDDYIRFPIAERAPPEAYFTLGYEAWAHKDPAYCDYAFFYCVNRSVVPEELPTATSTGPGVLQSTRAKNTGEKSQVTHKPGANFVDAALCVVIEQAAGTVISFQPRNLHGTSRGYGASNAIISINFSKRVGDAWAEVKATEASGNPLVTTFLGNLKQYGAGLDEEDTTQATD